MANINVRVTEEFEADIIRRAEKQGMDKSEYVRTELAKDKNELIAKLTDELRDTREEVESLLRELKDKESEIELLKSNHEIEINERLEKEIDKLESNYQKQIDRANKDKDTKDKQIAELHKLLDQQQQLALPNQKQTELLNANIELLENIQHVSQTDIVEEDNEVKEENKKFWQFWK